MKRKVVESGVGTGASVNSTLTLDYTYGAPLNASAQYDYRGHEWTKVTDQTGNNEKSWFYTSLAVNGKTDVYWVRNKCYKKEVFKNGASTPTSYTAYDWSETMTYGDTRFVYLAAQSDYLDSVSKMKRFYYDTYGNLQKTREYTSASASESDWARSTVRDYVASTASKYFVSKLARETVYKKNASYADEVDWIAMTHYCYDGAYYWSTVIGSGSYGDNGSYRGLLTAVRKVKDTNNCFDVRFVYDAYGNQTSASEYNVYGTYEGVLANSQTRTTTTSYESTYHTFPYQVTNPLSQVVTSTFDARWGTVSSVTDINGGVTDYTRDSYGRLTKVEGPQVAGPTGNSRRTTVYTYYAPATANGRTTNQIKTETRKDLGGATPTYLTTRQFYDGLGRLIQAYADGYSGVNIVNTYFDQRGLHAKASVSHTGTSTGIFLDSDWANYNGAVTTTTYDELRRSVMTTLPDSKTAKAIYSGWNSWAIDQNGHGKKSEKDALGRVTYIRELTGDYSGDPANPGFTTYASTAYTYDYMDRLLTVTDNVSNVTTVTYDGLGRKTAMADPDMGSWSYSYDPIGTMASQTDAKSQTIYLYYDILKRMVRKWYPVCWTDETITAGSSRPTVWDLMELRNVVNGDRKAAGLSAFTWTDPAIVPGSGVAIKALHFNEIKSAIQDLWTAASLGAIPQFTGGAIVAGTRAIKASDLTDLRGWLASYENSTYGQSHRARVFYEYDGYDGSTQFGKGKRTTMWDGCGRQSLWYDIAGRTTKEERTIDGTVYTTQWTYDASGRVYQTTLPDNEVLTNTYAANGLLSQTSSSIGSTNYVSGTQYNALNLPTQYTLGSGTTATARYTYYVGTDHLGSTIRTADTSFAVVDGMRYKSYGESRDTGGNLQTDHKFTGQIEDAGIGLYWYNSRAYDAALGRFVNADTIVPSAANPQALNRYSYVGNNPLRYVDPSGHDYQDPESIEPNFFTDEWRTEFKEKNGRDPDRMDKAYRLTSMMWANNYPTAWEASALAKIGPWGNQMIPRDLYGEFVSGQGPEHRLFVAGDHMAEEFRQHEHIRKVMAAYISALAKGECYIGQTGENNFSLEGAPVFQPIPDTITVFTDGADGRNPTVAFLGSYKLTTKVLEIDQGTRNAKIYCHAYNTTTTESNLRIPNIGYGAAQEEIRKYIPNPPSGPFSMKTQDFCWVETVQY